MSYIIRRYQPGDETGIIKVLAIVFDGWPHRDLECSPLDHWKWKFLDNPFNTIISPVAVSGNLIVGTNHGYSIRVKIFQNVFQSSQGTDLAVHPKYRRMGIYTKASEFKTKIYEEEQYDFTFAITGNPIVYKTNLTWGRRSLPYKLSILMRIKNVDFHLKIKKSKYATLKKIGLYFLKIQHKLANYFLSVQNEQDFMIKQITRFNEGFGLFWDIIKNNYDFIIERSTKYLNWRYCDPRAGKYFVKVAEKDGRYLGYIVLRINRYDKNYPEGYIVDLLALPKRPDVAQALIKDSVQFFDDNNINIIHYLIVQGHPYESLVKRTGFFDSRYSPFFIIQNIRLKEEWDDIQKIPAHRLHYQYGDSDLI